MELANVLETNRRFLTNVESAEVYQQPNQPAAPTGATNEESESPRSSKSKATKSIPGKQPRQEPGELEEPAKESKKSFGPADSTNTPAPAAPAPVSLHWLTANNCALRQSPERIKAKRYLNF